MKRAERRRVLVAVLAGLGAFCAMSVVVSGRLLGGILAGLSTLCWIATLYVASRQ